MRYDSPASPGNENMKHPMKIKICGLKRKEDISYVNGANPDYVGFVFAGSKRKVDFETAKILKRQLKEGIPAVGVFVNEEIDFVVKLALENVIDVIQLHGDEDAAYIEALRKRLAQSIANYEDNITIIKVIRVKNQEQVLEAEKINVNYLLLDAFKEDEYGGSGKVFDHNLIPKLSKPYFLAGGISSDNIIGILDMLKEKDNLPYCVDVSSSVETDGVKDQKKINEIVELVHSFPGWSC